MTHLLLWNSKSKLHYSKLLDHEILLHSEKLIWKEHWSSESLSSSFRTFKDINQTIQKPKSSKLSISSATSASNKGLRIKKSWKSETWMHYPHSTKLAMKYLLHSRILSVRSSNCLLCLLVSLIFSNFWNPFLHYDEQHAKFSEYLFTF